MKVYNSMNINGVAKIVCAELYKADIDNMLMFNTHNRPLNRNRVEYLKRSINNGEWKFNGATIVFDADGILRDGQTRLTAFKESKESSFGALIVYLKKGSEAATAVQKTIDKGQQRTYAQQLCLDGFENSKKVASLRRAIAVYSEGVSAKCVKFTDGELDEIGRKYKDEISLLSKIQCLKTPVYFNSFSLAVICVLAKRHKKLQDIYDWCLKIANCECIEKGSTSYTFMRFLMSCRGKIDSNFASEVMKKTENILNAHLCGNEKLTRATMKKGSR